VEISVTKASEAGLTNIILLYVFGSAIALYPPLAQFAQPVIFVSFLAILLTVLYRIFFFRQPISNSVLFKLVSIFSVVYVVWLFVAALYANNIAYALQDSLGFPIYLLVMPIFFIFIQSNKLHRHLLQFLIYLCSFIASISLGIILWYYASFGAVEAESLVVMNAFIKSLNLNWMIDNNSGFLGLYTYTAHFLLLGIGLAFFNYYVCKKKIYIYLMLLFGFGVLADGHRALVVSMFLLIIFLFPLIKNAFRFKNIIASVVIVALPLLLVFVANFDWILDRFNFTGTDPSTLERFLQIPALLDKIMESPIMGNGFGSFAKIIRNQERPFLYEVDFLATIMKLGLLGSLLYFGAYLYVLDLARRKGGVLGYILFSVGLSFLFYMGTNGGLAMSPDCAIFHMFLFILISLSISRNFECELKHDYSSNKTATLRWV
jgi:hypothetical protein